MTNAELWIGAAASVALALVPWLIMVHAKLAVIASKIVDLCDKVEQAREEHRRLWSICSRHASRLDTHDVQLAHVAERLKE